MRNFYHIVFSKIKLAIKQNLFNIKKIDFAKDIIIKIKNYFYSIDLTTTLFFLFCITIILTRIFASPTKAGEYNFRLMFLILILAFLVLLSYFYSLPLIKNALENKLISIFLGFVFLSYVSYHRSQASQELQLLFHVDSANLSNTLNYLTIYKSGESFLYAIIEIFGTNVFMVGMIIILILMFLPRARVFATPIFCIAIFSLSFYAQNEEKNIRNFNLYRLALHLDFSSKFYCDTSSQLFFIGHENKVLPINGSKKFLLATDVEQYIPKSADEKFDNKVLFEKIAFHMVDCGK